MQTSTSDQIRAAVRQAYGAVATQETAERLLRRRDVVAAARRALHPNNSAIPTPTSPPCLTAPTWVWAAATLRLSLASDLANASSTSGVAPDSTPSSPLDKSVRPDMSSAWT